MKKLTENINWTLVAVVGGLIVIGLVNLYSALKLWGESGFIRLFWSQTLWIAIGAFFSAMLAFFDYRLLTRLAYPLYVISMILLVLVLLSGKVVAGHKSWLGIAGIGIQPSEFAKVTMIFALAKYFGDNPHPDGLSLLDLIRPGILAAVPTGLVVMQGDFGSALFFILFFFSFAWFAKLRRNATVIIILLSVIGSVFSYYYVFSDYQKARFTTFLNPSYDVKGSGYHLLQSKIAVGSGKIFGKGYLKGSINKLRYLPEKHTDFVFPVLAEEWGFAGCLVTLLFYFVLIVMAIEIAGYARERFGIFLAVGTGMFIFWHVTINLGGVLGLMPLTGVTLPFLSYGGSSIISTMVAVGILLSVSRRRFVF